MKLGTYQLKFTYDDNRYRAEMICEATQQRTGCESARVTDEEMAASRYDVRYYQKRDFLQTLVRMLSDHALTDKTTQPIENT